MTVSHDRHFSTKREISVVMGNHSTNRDSTNRDSTTRVSTNRDSTTRDSTNRDSTTRDSTNHDSTNGDTTNRDSTNRDSTNRPPDVDSAREQMLSCRLNGSDFLVPLVNEMFIR